MVLCNHKKVIIMDAGISEGAGLLILRAVSGILYIVHGSMKVRQPSRNQLRQMMAQLGIPGPLFDLVALLEVGGGVALIVGLLARFASILYALFMVGNLILYATKLSKPPVSKGYVGGYELDTLLLGIAILIALTGPGVYSLDHIIGLDI